MAIAAALVKELREMTGAGLMDCKRALEATDGNIEAAVDWLRTKGMAKVAKKADRIAAEGLVGINVSGTTGAIVEINSETDFVARNEQFQKLVASVAALAPGAGGDIDKLSGMGYPDANHTVGEEISATIVQIGENLNLRRTAVVVVNQGVVATYVHSGVGTNLGKIGVLVGLESTGNGAELGALGKQIAMHVAAARPLAISSDDLDPKLVAAEREMLKQQAIESGKPPEIAEKMVEGRIRKYFSEVCLLSQTFVIDGETSISEVLEKAASTLGAPVSISAFECFVLGEGVEKKSSDFAAEVAATAGKS
ncbi:MAG: elongation factor Ts [Alphaproteobacteria bacterium]|nr:elongation factor Ts [Alphaproteobacteria bacterium]